MSTGCIPHDWNCFCDAISKFVNHEDYEVTDDFFKEVANKFQIKFNLDRFANNVNTKTVLFNSLSFRLGTSGIVAFN